MGKELETVVLCIFLVFACAITNMFHFEFSTGIGKQAGYISEVERTGMLWRPPQVKLISIVPTYSERDTVWYFGATDGMAKLAEEYSKNNTKVVVSYRQVNFVWSWDYSSTILIESITPITE
jgi:hypothetical protein